MPHDVLAIGQIEIIRYLYLTDNITQMSLKLSMVFIIHNLLTTEGREMNTK